jgi:S1-C subfamily serine protease
MIQIEQLSEGHAEYSAEATGFDSAPATDADSKPLSHRWVLVSISAAILLVAGLVFAAFYTLSVLPSADWQQPPSPPKFWIPVSYWTVPVTPTAGRTMPVASRPLNLVPSTSEVEPPVAEQLWRMAAPATIRVQARHSAHEAYLGGGVIVSPSGLVLTAMHVVNVDFQSIHILWNDGQERLASVVATDPQHDLALLQIRHTDSESFRFLRVAGSEYGTGFYVGMGTSAALFGFGESQNTLRELPVTLSDTKLYLDLSWAGERKIHEDPTSQVYEFSGNAIQGDSGSPVVDERGTVIGIVSGANGTEFVAGLPRNFPGLKL